MKSYTKYISAAFVAVAMIVGTARATSINGEVNFKSDSSTTDTGNLATATSFTGFTNVQVSTGTQDGSYIGTDGAAVTFAPFSFSAVSVSNLWSFWVGLTHYTFDATSVGIASQSATYLNVGGAGIAYITGYDPTPGTWSVTSTTQGRFLTFSAATTVPDGGMTALLLGAALLSLGVAARRKNA